MPGQDESTRNGYEDGEDKARWVVASMLEGTGLDVQVLAHELVITNPHLRDRGQIHVDFDGGHVSWEPPCFQYWGVLEGFEDHDGAGHVTRDKIIATLTARGHPVRPATPAGPPRAAHRRVSIPAVPRWANPARRTGGRTGVARVFPGQPAELAAARRWAATLASVRGADSSDASVVASELVTNAITHTRCGQPGGIITLALTSRLGRVTLHVHDLGTSDGEMPTLRPAATGQDGLAEGNRGLQVVAALGMAWGTRPAVNCPASRPSDLAAAMGGCCTWCTLTCKPHQHGGRGRTSAPAGMVGP